MPDADVRLLITASERARLASPSAFVVIARSGARPWSVVSSAQPAMIPSRPRRSSGSPPVNRTCRIPSSSTPMRTRRTTSSSVRVASEGSQSRPSGGMQ